MVRLLPACDTPSVSPPKLVTINPTDVEREPLSSGGLRLPEWPRSALDFIQSASKAGESVSLSAEEETLTPAQMADEIGVSRPASSGAAPAAKSAAGRWEAGTGSRSRRWNGSAVGSSGRWRRRWRMTSDPAPHRWLTSRQPPRCRRRRRSPHHCHHQGRPGFPLHRCRRHHMRYRRSTPPNQTNPPHRRPPRRHPHPTPHPTRGQPDQPTNPTHRPAPTAQRPADSARTPKTPPPRWPRRSPDAAGRCCAKNGCPLCRVNLRCLTNQIPDGPARSIATRSSRDAAPIR